MQDLEKSLANITPAPCIVKAMALIGVRRRSGSNMFRGIGILKPFFSAKR